MKSKQLVNIVGKFLSKNSPYILAGVGATAVVGGTVLIAKKARKAMTPEIVGAAIEGQSFDERISDDIAEARYVSAQAVLNGDIDKKKERGIIVKAYMKAAWKYTKYYAAPVMLVGGGIACMLSALLIQTKRLRVMSAAYTTLAAAFNEYRDRVRAVVGEEKEEDIFKGIVRDEKGNVISENPLLDDKYKENTREFSRLFGDGNSVYWSKNTQNCIFILQGAESNLNNLLRYQGFVTLNDVWKELGMKPSEEGMYLGWRWKYGDPEYGSTYISLGFSGPKNQEKCEELKHSWKEEFWITLVPPHTLFGKIPKEKIRSEDEKQQIIAKRRKVITVEE